MKTEAVAWEIIKLNNDFEIIRDENGEFWLQHGQIGAGISRDEYELLRFLALWTARNSAQPPSEVTELGKNDQWYSAFDAEIAQIRNACFAQLHERFRW